MSNIEDSKKLQRHVGKYSNKNRIHSYLLNNFQSSFYECFSRKKYQSVLEIGCGEGYLIRDLIRRGLKLEHYLGIDIRKESVKIANVLFSSSAEMNFECVGYENLESKASYDLIICSQVLEHLPDPESCIRKIRDFASEQTEIILSVPWEPWFRLGNLARGRDLTSFGNHPEHIQHWSASSFKKFVSSELQLVDFKKSFPFLIGKFKRPKC